MAGLVGKIKGIQYHKVFERKLPSINFTSDINEWSPSCCVSYNNIIYSVSKWVTPKRSRSYPYSRIYDTYNVYGGKTVTIIPFVKDEGCDGDLDYLQWDTISLMSLLNIYVIIGYYDRADVSKKSGRKPNKITNQKLNDNHIKEQLKELSNYHSSALHWNLGQLKTDKLDFLMNKVIEGYNFIHQSTGVALHKRENLEKFKQSITINTTNFMCMSRAKAKQAQNREVLTIQPKESLGIGTKTSIEIENYLGGNYCFTIDDVIIKDNTHYLIESKHSRSLLIPSLDDIKDGLIKMVVYSNIDELRNTTGHVLFMPVLRLTSTRLCGCIMSTSSSGQISTFIDNNNFTDVQVHTIETLFQESNINNFEVIIEGVMAS